MLKVFRKKLNKLQWLVLVFLTLIFSAAKGMQPVAPEIESAFSFISSQQLADGSFSSVEPITLPYHTTARVAQLLSTTFFERTVFSNAQTYISSGSLSLVEERARRLFIASSAEDLSEIISAGNIDGGFGAESGFSSNVLDTSLALLAMQESGEPVGAVGQDVVIPAGGSHVAVVEIPADAVSLVILVRSITDNIEVRIAEGAEPGSAGIFFPVSISNTNILITPASTPALVAGTNFIKFTAPTGSVLSYTINYSTPAVDTTVTTGALQYLLDAQNSNGGWGLQPGDGDSRLYYTYWALKALGTVSDMSAISTFVSSAEESGGGFSDINSVNEFSTALALSILGLLGEDANILVPDSVSYLTSAQQLDGGFTNDPFVTAWGMNALLSILPPIEPVVSSNGGAGVGQDFITDLGALIIRGFAPVGSVGIDVNVAFSSITYDELTGEYEIVLDLVEGANTVTIQGVNIGGILGEIKVLNITRDSGLSGQDIDLVSGFNPLGFALNPANPLDTHILLELLGSDAIEVQKLDSITGLYSSYKRDDSGGFAGTNFSLSGLDGVNVLLTNGASARVVGNVINPATIDLVTGVNIVTVPAPPVDLTAYGLLASIGDDLVVSSVQWFNKLTGAYETAAYVDSTVSGTDFKIEKGVAYFLSMRQPLADYSLPVGVETSVTIATPDDGAIITSSPLIVTGTAAGVAPLDVTVNGVMAVVTGNSYTASIPLTVTGLVPVTVIVVDDVGGSSSDSISITYSPVDYVISIGSSVSDTGTFTAPVEVLPDVAFFSLSLIGLPAGINYSTDLFQIASSGEVTVDFTISATVPISPGGYTFQAEYGLLDAGSNPLGPLVGNIFTFEIEVLP